MAHSLVLTKNIVHYKWGNIIFFLGTPPLLRNSIASPQDRHWKRQAGLVNPIYIEWAYRCVTCTGAGNRSSGRSSSSSSCGGGGCCSSRGELQCHPRAGRTDVLVEGKRRRPRGTGSADFFCASSYSVEDLDTPQTPIQALKFIQCVGLPSNRCRTTFTPIGY